MGGCRIDARRGIGITMDDRACSTERAVRSAVMVATVNRRRAVLLVMCSVAVAPQLPAPASAEPAGALAVKYVLFFDRERPGCDVDSGGVRFVIGVTTHGLRGDHTRLFIENGDRRVRFPGGGAGDQDPYHPLGGGHRATPRARRMLRSLRHEMKATGVAVFSVTAVRRDDRASATFYVDRSEVNRTIKPGPSGGLAPTNFPCT
jgi:hypothetical protein